MKWKGPIALAAVVVAGGCVQTRYYPVCIFGPDSRFPSDAALEARLERFARAVVGEKARISLSPNTRLVVVAHGRNLARLAQAWPRVACVGSTRDRVEYENYKQCVRLITAGLTKGGLPPLGERSDGIGQDVIFCANRLDGPPLPPSG